MVRGHHVDPRPEGGALEAVTVLGQPDALQPDDEHELQPASAEGTQQIGDVAGGEGPDPEQVQPEHGVLGRQLDMDEEGQKGEATDDGAQYERVGPPHGVAAVGLDAVDDPGQEGYETHRERDVAGPVELRREAHAVVHQLQIGPGRAEQPEGHAHQEDQPPVDWRQDAPDQ